MSDDWRIFLLGLFGSLAVEVVAVVRTYERGRTLSVRYQRPVYLLSRLLLAGAGGVLAWAYHVNNDILAVHIGASTPLLLEQMVRDPDANPPAG